MGKNINSSQIKNTIGMRLREERLMKGWTIEKLSEYLELSPSFLGSVELGKRALSIENLYSVTELFNITADSLMKTKLSKDAMIEVLELLVDDLNDEEFNSICDIVRIIKKQFIEMRK